jgi:outer membrane usher protein
VNYDVSLEQRQQGRQAGGLFELGAFGRHGVAIGTLVARQDETDSRSLVRLDTAWTRDFPDRIATLRVGDAISTPANWGRAVRFGGIQYGTNFSTQPTLVTTPLLVAQGEAVVPSTVDVFVNGRQIASESVPPGRSRSTSCQCHGAGQLRSSTDVLGREQAAVQRYYSGTAPLREGSMNFHRARQYPPGYGSSSFGTANRSVRLRFVAASTTPLRPVFTPRRNCRAVTRSVPMLHYRWVHSASSWGRWPPAATVQATVGSQASV